MNEKAATNTNNKTIAIILVTVIAAAAVFGCLIGIVFIFKGADYDALKKTGSQWVSDDGNISFTVYHEMLLWSSSDDENTIDEIWNQRYVGFGQMSSVSGDIYISCIISDTTISVSLFGYSADYTDISDSSSVDIAIKEISDTEIVATVTRIRHEANWFSYNIGDKIRFTQVNDVSDLDTSDYEFFVDAVERSNAASANTEITIYKREDIADKLKKFEERQSDNFVE